MILEVKIQMKQIEAGGIVMMMPASPTSFEATQSPISNLQVQLVLEV